MASKSANTKAANKQKSAQSISQKAPKIAIVGMACRFPKADSLEQYWSNIRRGVDSITEIPDRSHWDPKDYFDEDKNAPDMTYARRGGFINPVDFDVLDFGISPNNIEATDTTQLLGMVVAKDALLDAGYETGWNTGDGRTFDRDRCSAIVGVTGTLELVIPLGARLGHPLWRRALEEAGVDQQTADDVCDRISHGYIPWQENSFPGLLGNVAAGRIANRFDLGGSNCVVDAACASSLSAIHMAILELQTGRSDMAITGGLDTFNDIFMYMCFSKTPALSPTGNSRPFDENGDGTILGEGLGILILKRLDDAQRDGDKIYAVIDAIGSSSDGRGNAIYAPSSKGQAKCLRDAYETAGVSPDEIDLLEAHGTGTRVGDAVELSALNEVYASDRSSDAPVHGNETAIGSVKSMVGHTKAAAGAAGLIKAALALKHRTLPPTIKVERPQGEVKPSESGIHVNSIARPLTPKVGDKTELAPARAAMSAFGFGGSNYHCVLESPPPRKPGNPETPEAPKSPEALSMTERRSLAIQCDGTVIWLLLSSQSTAELSRQLERLIDEVKAQVAAESHPELKRNLLYNLLRGQSHQLKNAFDFKQPARLSITLERQDHTEKAPEQEVKEVLDRLTKASLEIKAGDNQAIALKQISQGIYLSTKLEDQTLGILFPGQGSQYVNMFSELFCLSPVAQDLLAKQEAISPLSKTIYPPPAFDPDEHSAQETRLRQTSNAQPALGLTAMAAWKVMQTFGVSAAHFAGHSFGEIPALWAAGVMDDDAAIKTALARGNAMHEAAAASDKPTSMLAVLCDKEKLLNAVTLSDELVIANENSPKQFVLSGSEAAIDEAAKLLKAKKIKAKKLNVAAAFHSQFVSDASKPFKAVLDKIKFQKPKHTVYGNTHAAPYSGPLTKMRSQLAEQLAGPVRFIDMIQQMIKDGVTTFVEVGPGQVLSGLVQKITAAMDAADSPVVITLDRSSTSKQNHLGNLKDLSCVLGQLALLGQRVELEAWDPKAADFVTDSSKKKLTVRLTGANYVNPERRESLPVKPKARIETKTEKVVTRRIEDSEAKRSTDQWNQDMTQNNQQATPNGQQQAVQAYQNQALAITQQSILAMQRLQEQTAMLHKQYLDGQMASQQALMQMLNQQQQLMGQGAMPIPTMPTMSTMPTAPTTPPVAPVQPPMPAPQQPIQPMPPMPPIPPVQQAAPAYTPAPPPVAPQPVAPAPVQPAAPVAPPQVTPPAPAAQIPKGAEPEPRTQISNDVTPQLPQASGETSGDSGDSGGAESILLAVVAEKTGYPTSMLELDMAMEADLGIDSIKRVEILSGMQDKMPDAPAVKPEDLGTLETLRDVIDYLAAQSGGSAAPTASAAHPASSGADAENILLEVVAEKTGYPTSMLELDMAMEADLGIDSIKRVEILSGMQDKMPDAPAVKPEDLGSLETLRDVITYLEGANSGKV